MPQVKNIRHIDGYSRPQRNIFELFQRLEFLQNEESNLFITLQKHTEKLQRLTARMDELQQEANHAPSPEWYQSDIECKAKEINRAEDQLASTQSALKNSKNNFYEIKQILARLDRLSKAAGPDRHHTALPTALELNSRPLPYHVTDADIDAAIRCYQAAATHEFFSATVKGILDMGIQALNGLRQFRTFETYDIILVGTVIHIMLTMDAESGPSREFAQNQYLYPLCIKGFKEPNLIALGRKALIEKTLPFDGKIYYSCFKSLIPVFPNYLTTFYELDTNAAKLDTTRRTERHFKKINDKKLLKYFKEAYLKDYQLAIFKNPFSKMKEQLAHGKLSMQVVRDYAANHPASRTARVLKVVIERGTQRSQIRDFSNVYYKLHQQKSFKNPFSFMRRQLSRMTSTDVIYHHSKTHAHSTSAKAFDTLIQTEERKQAFLKR